MSDQFEDAPDDATTPLEFEQTLTAPALSAYHTTRGTGYIDTEDKSEGSGSSIEEEEEDGDEFAHSGEPPLEGDAERDLLDALRDSSFAPVEGEDEQIEEDDYEHYDIEDEDWEIADGDFTKQFNRLRQHRDALHPSNSSSSTARPLPARNAHVKPAPASAASKTKIMNSLAAIPGVAANPKNAMDKANQKDKSDRATTEQVLDPRTRLVLVGLINRGVIGIVEGCVSTGKEANVYHALPSADPPALPDPFPTSLALKIYRTSILTFKSRQAYILGEHRFRGAYASSHNPRKMVRLWAEKELRNLRRLEAGGIRAPRVIEGRENVLVMEFLGVDGAASPRLKDAEISRSKLPELYAELLVAMRRMFNACHLVHADLSEYNILYHLGHLIIIDVSQSVEHDHPRAFDFLRKDIANVEDFFRKRSGGEVKTLGVRRTWDFVVSESLPGIAREDEEGLAGEERLKDVVRVWLDADEDAHQQEEEDEPESAKEQKRAQAQDDAVFLASYIPRSLADVYDPERDVAVLKSGKGENLIYKDVVGLDLQNRGGPSEGTKGVRFEEDASGDDEVDGEEEDDDEDEGGHEKKPRGFRHEDKDAKKERKKALKEENREKRKTKMPKAEKQRRVKQTASK